MNSIKIAKIAKFYPKIKVNSIKEDKLFNYNGEAYELLININANLLIRGNFFVGNGKSMIFILKHPLTLFFFHFIIRFESGECFQFVAYKRKKKY